MYLEGCAKREYVQYLQEAGYDISYIIENPEQAAEENISLDADIFEDGNVWIRLYIDESIEEYLTISDIAQVFSSDERWDVLALMAESEDGETAETAKEILGNRHKKF
jgi:hypothetical protein